MRSCWPTPSRTCPWSAAELTSPGVVSRLASSHLNINHRVDARYPPGMRAAALLLTAVTACALAIPATGAADPGTAHDHGPGEGGGPAPAPARSPDVRRRAGRHRAVRAPRAPHAPGHHPRRDLAGGARRDLPLVGPGGRPRPDPGLAADHRPGDPGAEHRLRVEQGGAAHPDRPADGRPGRRHRRHQRRLLRHRRHRRTARSRGRPGARAAQRAQVRLEPRLLHQERRAVHRQRAR